ncbi:hypothetical protein F5I97DRAFT_1117633 [Phlebopus sp. FC_14]|nr:hypothetical protein F5I97DRAFT_1117633 [Phlebopus sp. FC_14]
MHTGSLHIPSNVTIHSPTNESTNLNLQSTSKKELSTSTKWSKREKLDSILSMTTLNCTDGSCSPMTFTTAISSFSPSNVAFTGLPSTGNNMSSGGSPSVSSIVPSTPVYSTPPLTPMTTPSTSSASAAFSSPTLASAPPTSTPSTSPPSTTPSSFSTPPIPSPSTPSASTPTPTTSASTSSTPSLAVTTQNTSTRTGLIIGLTFLGIGIVSLTVAAAFLFIRRRFRHDADGGGGGGGGGYWQSRSMRRPSCRLNIRGSEHRRLYVPSITTISGSSSSGTGTSRTRLTASSGVEPIDGGGGQVPGSDWIDAGCSSVSPRVSMSAGSSAFACQGGFGHANWRGGGGKTEEGGQGEVEKEEQESCVESAHGHLGQDIQTSDGEEDGIGVAY